jgi:hypothetical protein
MKDPDANYPSLLLDDEWACPQWYVWVVEPTHWESWWGRVPREECPRRGGFQADLKCCEFEDAMAASREIHARKCLKRTKMRLLQEWAAKYTNCSVVWRFWVVT